MNMAYNWQLEIAARTPFEQHGGDDYTSMTRRYRFDTCNVTGDYTIVEVALPFACEEVARAAFYELIRKY